MASLMAVMEGNIYMITDPAPYGTIEIASDRISGLNVAEV